MGRARRRKTTLECAALIGSSGRDPSPRADALGLFPAAPLGLVVLPQVPSAPEVPFHILNSHLRRAEAPPTFLPPTFLP